MISSERVLEFFTQERVELGFTLSQRVDLFRYQKIYHSNFN